MHPCWTGGVTFVVVLFAGGGGSATQAPFLHSLPSPHGRSTSTMELLSQVNFATSVAFRQLSVLRTSPFMTVPTTSGFIPSTLATHTGSGAHSPSWATLTFATAASQSVEYVLLSEPHTGPLHCATG